MNIKRWKELSLVAAGIAAGLLLSECLVRLIHPMDLQPPFIESFGVLNAKPPYTAIHHKAMDFDVTYLTNRYGFRGKDVLFRKPRGTYRILTLGDSFTWGSGIEENGTYSAVLENKLNLWASSKTGHSLQGRRFEVINLGLQGVGLGVIEYLYRKLGRFFHPDLVVLCFITQNADFERRVVFADPGTVQRTRRIRSMVRWIPGYRFLCMHSHFLAFLRMYATSLVLHEGVGRMSSSIDLKDDRQRLQFKESEISRTLEALIEQTCKDGAKLAVMSIDDHLRQYPNVYPELRRRARRSPCLSIVELQVGPRHAFKHDWHWSPEGHRFVAEKLFQALIAGNGDAVTTRRL